MTRVFTSRDVYDTDYFIRKIENGTIIALTGVHGGPIWTVKDPSHRITAIEELRELKGKIDELIEHLTDDPPYDVRRLERLGRLDKSE